MSVHDETWDRCRWCGKVNKDWHGDYHTSKGCLEYDNYYDWFQSLMIEINETEVQYITKSGMIITKTIVNEKNKE